MAKRFSPEFKQQAIDYALSNSHESVAAIAQKLGVGYSTLDKWIREANPVGSSKRQLSPEQQRIVELKKEFKQLKEAIKFYYNPIRRHSANGWLSPEAFEQKYIKSLEGLVVHDTV